MKSGRQRRAEIRGKRRQRATNNGATANAPLQTHSPGRLISVNEALLAPNNSYGVPDFVARGYYVDLPFRCVECGKEEVWTGTQQKWWYEVAKGFVYSTAVRCRTCRRKKRDQRDEGRRIHQEGLLGKRNQR